MAKQVETQQRILNAAIHILERDGEENLRITDVCKKAPVTAPSIYHFFADRSGLIDAAQTQMFKEGQVQMGRRFVDATHACTSRAQFSAVVHEFATITFSMNRRDHRRRRVRVLGRAQFSMGLAEKLAEFQDESNKMIAEGLRFARAKGWIDSDIDLEMFAAWFIGMSSARTFIEFDGEHHRAAAWNEIGLRSIFRTLNLPRPNGTTRKSTGQRKRA